jgi:drug/metabolite transporter (DMT)-like permease
MLRFSLKQLFASMLAIGIGTALFGWIHQNSRYGPPPNQLFAFVACFGGIALLGAGIGNLFRRPILGAFLVVGVQLLYIAVIMFFEIDPTP